MVEKLQKHLEGATRAAVENTSTGIVPGEIGFNYDATQQEGIYRGKTSPSSYWHFLTKEFAKLVGGGGAFTVSAKNSGAAATGVDNSSFSQLSKTNLQDLLDEIDSKLAAAGVGGPYLRQDGTTPLTGNWNTGAHNIRINDSANTNMTLGLTINQGAADDQIIALKSSDVHHSQPGIENDTYGYLQKFTAGYGGLDIVGITDTADNIPGLTLRGLMPNDETNLSQAILLYAARHDGATSETTLSDTKGILAIYNYTTELLKVLGNGNIDGIFGKLYKNAWTIGDNTADNDPTLNFDGGQADGTIVWKPGDSRFQLDENWYWTNNIRIATDKYFYLGTADNNVQIKRETNNLNLTNEANGNINLYTNLGDIYLTLASVTKKLLLGYAGRIELDIDGIKSTAGSTLHVIAQTSAPSTTTAGALWLDTDDGTNGTLKCYANGAWRTVAAL